MPDLTRPIVVFGATGAVGAAIATRLARTGHSIILVARSISQLDALCNSLVAETGNSRIEPAVLDVSVMQDVLAWTTRAHQDSPIGSVIFAAGALSSERVETSEGIELIFATQYLYRFLVSMILGESVRSIIAVGAPILPFSRIRLDDLQLRNGFHLIKAMAQVQLIQHCFVQWFSRYYPSVSMNIIAPGFIKSNLLKGIRGPIRWAGEIGLSIIGNSPELPATTMASLLESPEFQSITGHFFPKPGKPAIHHKIAFPPELGDAVVQTTKNLLTVVLGNTSLMKI